MKLLELFAGSRSITKVALNLGWKTCTTDNFPFPKIDYVCDIFDFNNEIAIDELGGYPSFIWASPPCTTFSVASIGRHWNKNNTPKTDEAIQGVKIIEKTIEIITYFKRKNPNLIFFIENPVGKLRKLDLLNPNIKRELTYCQYGESRQKPTDLWTNMYWWKPKPRCRRKASCHEPAWNGSLKTGVQSQKSDYERSRVPKDLCSEILNCYMEKYNAIW